MLLLKTADMKFLLSVEKVVRKTVGCQPNRSGCSVAASLLAKRTTSQVPETAIYLHTYLFSMPLSLQWQCKYARVTDTPQ